MRVSATAKYLRGSTRKTRLVTQAIKGKRVEEATLAAIAKTEPTTAQDTAPEGDEAQRDQDRREHAREQRHE